MASCTDTAAYSQTQIPKFHQTMISFPNTLISSLSEQYTASMCNGDPECVFGRSCIAAAYVVGAIETRRRITNIIKAVALCGDGLSTDVASRLLKAIQEIESKQ